VAHSLSAKKRVRQSIKRRARNRYRKELLKTDVKTFTASLTGGDVAKAQSEFRKVISRLDKTASKGTIHKNTAARKRSRLALKLNAAVAAGGKAAAPAKGKKKAKGTSGATA
jgi:small subunit ribosomal protein S20